MSGKFTPSIEDYLECIYQINLGQGVKSTDIAAKLSVSKPSVHRAIVTLAEMGLLSQEKYSLIYLTEAGQKKAAEVSEKHEILSGFLQDVLGIAPDVVEEIKKFYPDTIVNDNKFIVGNRKAVFKLV